MKDDKRSFVVAVLVGVLGPVGSVVGVVVVTVVRADPEHRPEQAGEEEQQAA
jgi:hypothetical protein